MSKKADSDRKLHESRGEFVRPRCCGFAMGRVCKRARRGGKLRWQACGWVCNGECGRIIRDRDIEIATEEK